jgi:hypothetical protein
MNGAPISSKHPTISHRTNSRAKVTLRPPARGAQDTQIRYRRMNEMIKLYKVKVHNASNHIRVTTRTQNRLFPKKATKCYIVSCPVVPYLISLTLPSLVHANLSSNSLLSTLYSLSGLTRSAYLLPRELHRKSW